MISVVDSVFKKNVDKNETQYNIKSRLNTIFSSITLNTLQKFHSETQCLTNLLLGRSLPLFTSYITGRLIFNLMRTDRDILNTILDKFPEKANILNKLFQKDEDFREICEDYVLCLNSIGKIIITNKRKDRILIEYKNTLIELEIEMLDYLKTMSAL